jgi:peptide deformylase
MPEPAPNAANGARPDTRVPKRQVVLYPDPVLRRKAQPVKTVDSSIRELVEDMFLLMDLEEGAGLAAPQVGESLRIFVTGTHERGVPRKAYINPVFVELGGEFESMDEGCLSLPEIRGSVRRPTQVTIRALDIDGREFTETSSDFSARVWQHEFDHLEGVLIIDKMSPLDRLRMRRAVKDLKAAADGDA